MSTTSSTKAEFDLAALCRPAAEASPLATAALGGVGQTIRYVNPAFCHLIGKSSEELTGKPFSPALCVRGEGEACLSILERVYRTGGSETYTDDAGLSYAMWPVLASNGRRVGTIVQISDATAPQRQIVAMNEALLVGSVRQHEQTEAAERLSTKLASANVDLRQFSFAASHDLREPLRMIASYTQLLARRLRGQLDENTSGYMKQILASTERMERLLDDLLSYARLSTDQELPEESIDLNLGAC